MTTIEIDSETAASIYAVGEMLNAPSLRPRPDFPGFSPLLAATRAPLEIRDGPRGRGLFATRAISAGDVLFSESATAWYLSRAPGADGLFTMSDASSPTAASPLLAALPPWPTLRTLRDTLTLAPEVRFDAETAFDRIASLTALGGGADGGARDAWSRVPATAPGVAQVDENAVSPRAQLISAIAQCNAFCAILPAGDSDWKRSLLWPLIGRMQVPRDRDLLFDDDPPLTSVGAICVLGALINHACAPNVKYACAWEEGAPAPVCTFTANEDISEGAEVLLAYLSDVDDTAARRRALLLTYRFRCTCSKCRADEPRAGTEEDPLAVHFPGGAGVEGVLDYFTRGGEYPAGVDVDREGVVLEEEGGGGDSDEGDA